MIVVDKEILKADRIRERRRLIGKLDADRTNGKEVIRTTMNKIWRTSKPATFTEVGKNTFIIILSLPRQIYNG